MTTQKWKQPSIAFSLAHIEWLNETRGFHPAIASALIARGYYLPWTVDEYLHPESSATVDPYAEFSDLLPAVDILEDCIINSGKIIICGDYDADGMTSTAVLIRALRHCGANVEYIIPNRMIDGYGINERIVDECGKHDVDTIITVDNGVSAKDACDLALTLGMRVIITDHHDLPDVLPFVHAILNPKLLNEDSPMRSLAGVGVAYILAISICARMGRLQNIVKPLMELFTVGTIADMASLTGINRRWVKRGLQHLAKSDVVGIQAILCCISEKHKERTGYALEGVTPDTIGFKIAPRINAIGRIGNPQTVIELLTTESSDTAYKLALELEECNERRQKLCEEIEKQAIEIVQSHHFEDLEKRRIVCLVGTDWHHGVIGIVASRLVERYGVPVFIGTMEGEQHIRGSARGIPEFNIFEAMQYSHDCFLKYGGHPMAGGFTMPLNLWHNFIKKVTRYALENLSSSQVGKQITIDASISLADIDNTFMSQLNRLRPFGVGNDEPVFRANKVYLDGQKKLSDKGIRFMVSDSAVFPCFTINALSWNLAEQFPLPSYCDIVFKVKEKVFRSETSIELEVIGVKKCE